ncbi:acyltransferase [uncultured Acetatifactor sp.]|uniref:acyltransferase n=1 Tax=uncultured Acetatifactor sp. TaxID=1671927 RepID=UPI002626AB0F|nr:acyltransferase [uncultured Acetatifactor sp.]
MANLELLRCVAMLMVVALHYLGKGHLLPELTDSSLGSMGMAAWLMESFCIVAVNVYMLISGYFLCTSSFKPSRLLQLWLQIWAYSLPFGLIGALTGVLREEVFDTHYLLTLLFPVTMGHYWFMTAYVFLYLLLPFVGAAVKKMSKQQLRLSLALLLAAFCIVKSVLPVRLEMDALGYDCLWYLCVFLAAAYVRRFGIPFLEKKGRGLMLYLGCCLLIFCGTFALREIYLRTGGLGSRIKMCLEYNHVLPFLAAIGLFGAFSRLRIQGRMAKIVNGVAPYTLGVYLLHENIGLRYSWQEWLGAGHLAEDMARGAGGPVGIGRLLGGTAVAVLAVFACGILVDMARKRIFDGLHSLALRAGFYRRLTEKIGKADALFREHAEP